MINCIIEKEGRKRKGGQLGPEWGQDPRHDGKGQECKGEGHNEASSSGDQGQGGQIKKGQKSDLSDLSDLYVAVGECDLRSLHSAASAEKIGRASCRERVL